MIVMLECVFKYDFEKFHNKILDDIEKKFGLTFIKDEGLPTHITLKYPFHVENFKELQDELDKFSKNHSKAKLFAKKFNHFNENTIFIDIKQSDEAKLIISQLNQTLKKISWISWDKFEGQELHLHSTVVMDSEGKFNEIMLYLNKISFNFEIFLDNITIIKEIPSNSKIRKWKVHKSYYLR